MSFELLVPLGLLALLTIPVLILIYILKPNFQTKHVSSTHIWQLSLKYKKKRIPINRLRNILIFICQILILTSIALIISRPAIFYDRNTDRSDVIAIIDSSASMYAETDGTTRFHRAVEDVITLSDNIMAEGGAMTVILADESPEYLATRTELKNRSVLMDTLEEYLNGDAACSYGSADIEGAIKLCEEILAENPAAKIYLYTDTTYGYVPKSIEVVPVMGNEEWNAAILNAEASLEDGYYTLTVEVACYGQGGMALSLDVSVQVNGANSNLSSEGQQLTFKQSVDCIDGKTQTIIFRRGGGEDMEGFVYNDLQESDSSFTSYQSISITIDERDSFQDDNSYQIYGGRKPIVNVLYSSTNPNPFFTSALDVLRNDFAAWWDIRITEIERKGGLLQDPFVTNGFDFYIYEHEVPDPLPSDGVVFLADPDKAPAGAGFTIVGRQQYQSSMYLSAEEEHPIVRHVVADYISVTRYTMLNYDPAYRVLMSCDTNPLLLVRDEGNVKIVLMPFSVHYSNIVELPEWYVMLYNTMNFFIPGTVKGNSFEVGEQVTVSPRGPSLKVFDANRNELGSYQKEEGAISFTVPLTFAAPGVYNLQQDSYFSGDVSNLNIFVKIPAVESNIWRMEDALAEPVIEQKPDNSIQELLLWVAVALVTLLFIEWLLQALDNR